MAEWTSARDTTRDGDRFIGPTGEAADRLKSVIDRRWDTIRTENAE